VLVGGYASVRRAGRLASAPLVGGDLAQAEPWRNAVVRLDAAGLSDAADRLFRDRPLAILRAAAAAGVNATPSSSAGRLFDAAAACLGLCADRQSFEGEAAMRLEALARSAPPDAGAYPFDLADGVLDPAPMFRALIADGAAGVAPETVAARFHRGVAEAFGDLAAQAAEAEDCDAVALSGGCFQNMLLLDLTLKRLAVRLPGAALCGPGQVPANDGGLAYGQALVALARMESN